MRNVIATGKLTFVVVGKLIGIEFAAFDIKAATRNAIVAVVNEIFLNILQCFTT